MQWEDTQLPRTDFPADCLSNLQPLGLQQPLWCQMQDLWHVFSKQCTFIFYLLSLLTCIITAAGSLYAACLFSPQLNSLSQLAAATELQQNPWKRLCFR